MLEIGVIFHPKHIKGLKLSSIQEETTLVE